MSCLDPAVKGNWELSILPVAATKAVNELFACAVNPVIAREATSELPFCQVSTNKPECEVSTCLVSINALDSDLSVCPTLTNMSDDLSVCPITVNNSELNHPFVQFQLMGLNVNCLPVQFFWGAPGKI